MSQVKNVYSKRMITKGSRTHKRVKYLQGLRSLNSTKTTIPNPKGGRPILVFGNSHINYLYNNFSLTDQNHLIDDFKKKLSAESNRQKIGFGIKEMKEKHRSFKENYEKDVEKARKVHTAADLARVAKLREAMKRIDEKDQEHHKKAIAAHKILEQEINKILHKRPVLKETNYRGLELTGMAAKLGMLAFLGAYRSYTMKPIKSNLFNFSRFFNDAKQEIKRLLLLKLPEMKGLKFKLSYVGMFRKIFEGDKDMDRIPEPKNFRSNLYEVLHRSDLNDAIFRAIADLIREVENFVENGSGWVFVSNTKLDINLYHYRPIRGSSFIQLPPSIAEKQACINIQNNDDKCFLWSVIAHQHPQKRNRQRVNPLQKYLKDYKSWKGKFPMKIQDIGKFEKQFNLSINVYSYKIKKTGPWYFPLYNTKNKMEDVTKVINLLLIKKGNKSHYVLINSMPRLLYQNYNGKGHGTVHLCPCCFKTYRTVGQVQAHLKNGCARFGERTEHPTAEQASEYVQFNSLRKMLKKPFVIYADFESILQDYEEKTKQTVKYQKHVSCSYAWKRVSTVEIYDKDIVLFRAPDDTIDVAEHFLQSLLDEADKIKQIMEFIVPMALSEEEEQEFQSANSCSLCGHSFNEEDEDSKKVRDHDHLTGAYRGAAHQSCNLQYGWRHYKIPVVFHNLRGYDSHLIIKALNAKFEKIECIPSSTEKFIMFSVGNLEFIDSLSFIQASLEKLVSSLSQNDLTNINTRFSNFLNHFADLTNDQKLLLTQKGIYPYDYMNSLEKFNETALPPMSEFYSKLNDENISEVDYKRAKEVWDLFNLNTLGDYHDLYLKTDVLLLADVFENFRTNCLTSYKLDPVHYYTLPGLAWDAALLMTGQKLDVFSDAQNDMYLMIERGIRGGISVISHRYSKANNKYMEDFDPHQPSKFITYLDANNLYGWAMIQFLPTGNFQWCEPEDFDVHSILESKDDSKTGHIFDVDLEYPERLHDLHNDYPLAPDRIAIKYDELSDHSKIILDIAESKHKPTEKLIPNLYDKQNYVIHERNLKLYLQLGLKLKKINRVISFDQSDWLKKYIDFNTEKRKLANSDFEKDMYKLMNNAVFGKTMENVRKRIRYELVNDKKRFAKLVNDVTFMDSQVINKDLIGVSRSKTVVNLDKPIIVGFAILELSKVLMYDFHYNTMKKRYGDKITLLMTDTDSLCYEIQTHDLYEDMKEYPNLYDFSDYPTNHFLHDKQNKKVIGKFKEENNGAPILEFVGIRPKMYAFKESVKVPSKMYIFKDGHKECKKLKGVKKSFVKKEIHFEDYYRSLMGETKETIQQVSTFNCIRSINHELYSIKVSKIGISALDDKRYLLDHVNTLAFGHCKIKKDSNGITHE